MSTSSFLALVLAGALVSPSAPVPERWSWPVGDGARPLLVSPFDAPEEQWGPGHRGIDLSTTKGGDVTAVAGGVVSHRGRIAGRGTLSITHADGVRSTYEPVDSKLSVGDPVRRGRVIGTVGDEPGHCSPDACLHLGAKRGTGYLDPLLFFGGRRVILLPVE